jgi:hypothetical protein
LNLLDAKIKSDLFSNSNWVRISSDWKASQISRSNGNHDVHIKLRCVIQGAKMKSEKKAKPVEWALFATPQEVQISDEEDARRITLHHHCMLLYDSN